MELVQGVSTQFIDALQTVGFESGGALSEVGSGAADRFFHNQSFEASPWQASCIELRVTKTEKILVQRRPQMSRAEFFKPAPLMKSAHTTGGDDAEKESKTSVEVVFYYETSRPEGLQAYRQIASLVLRELLPGVVENNSCIGFATWSIPRGEYYDMLMNKPQLPV